MPRGIKGSGKQKVAKVQKPIVVEKTRKPYPSREERIVMADQQIARLTKLNQERQVLVDKTEAVLAGRKEALAKSAAAIEKAIARKERLSQNPEAKVTVRTSKKAEKAQLNELMAAVKASGKSVEEFLSAIKESADTEA
ncbi:MAG: hypothetical protein RSC91_11050 [Clostridia bacterium]